MKKQAPWFLLALFAFGMAAFAQSTPKSDPPDSGYFSKYLANHKGFPGTGEDDAFARREAQLQRYGDNKKLFVNVSNQAAIERQRNPRLMPGALAPAGVPIWTSIGPTKTNHIENGVKLNLTDSGRMRSILPHPTDPNTVYLLTSSGGLWKTSNFLSNKPNWVALTDTQATTSGGAAAFGRDPNTIYVGLGDPFHGSGLTGGFMIKTSDGGATWSAPIGLPTASSIRDVKVDTSAAQDIVLVATDGGIYRSTDGGNSYNLALDPAVLDERFPFPDAAWSFVNTSSGWVVSVETQEVGFPGDGIGSLAFSTDHGASWNAISNSGNVINGAGRMTLGVGAPGDSVVYAWAANTDEFLQLDAFRSVNGGQDWTALNVTHRAPLNPNPDTCDANGDFPDPCTDVMGGQAFYNQMLLVDPADPNRNTFYLGGQLFSIKSTDGGATFSVIADWLAQFGEPYVHADYHAAAASTLGGKDTLFFGSDGGLFVSNDGGATWDAGKNEGIVSLLGYTMIANPFHPDSALMGLQDNGTFGHWGSGDNWVQSFGGDGIGVGWSQANTNVALASVEFGFIVRSTAPPTMQVHWKNGSTGINPNDGNFFTAIGTPQASVDPSGLVFYTYGGKHIYQTTDGAQTWHVIGAPGAGGIGASRIFRDAPHGVAVGPTLNDVAVIANGGRLVVTHDGGQTWLDDVLIGAAMPNWQGFNSTVAWADDATIYVGSESPNFNSGRVAKSSDGGHTFVDITNGLPDVPVDRVLVSPVNKNVLYVGNFLGVYKSTDGGASWSRFGAGLPMTEADDLYIPPNNSFLRIATFGRGIWQTAP